VNILITSASAKVELIRGFQLAIKRAASPAKIIACDSAPAVASRYVADEFVIQPEDKCSDYLSRWLTLCKENNVGIIIPTRDGELKALAAIMPDLIAAGILLPLPEAKQLDTCLNKIKFYQFCVANDFPVLNRISHPQAEDLPLYSRSAFGAGGHGAKVITVMEGISKAESDVDAYLLQPFCSLPEYSIDTLFSLTGKPLQAVVRRRLKVVAGESIVTRVENIPALSELALKLGENLGLKGHVIFQAFYSPEQGPYLIECNPRFGGASSVSIKAGLDSCLRIIEELSGDEEKAIRPRELQTGLTAYRYSTDLLVAGSDG
jgi:carbamoyl-phosphate synthase large subunit